MVVDGEHFRVMIDTGASVTLVKRSVTKEQDRHHCSVRLENLFGDVAVVTEAVCLQSVVNNSAQLGPLSAYVLPSLPLDVDLVLGLDVILTHGLSVERGGGVKFGPAEIVSAAVPEVMSSIEDKDFSAWFSQGFWSVRWNWKNQQSACSRVKPAGNYVKECDEEAVSNEIESWLESGVLVEHDPLVHGEVRQFLSLLAVRQQKGDVLKVRPVFDYRDLNESLESHPGGSTPVCAERLRTWRQVEGNSAVIDLKAAYLQIRVDPDLWLHQAIKWKGKVLLLTRLGFGIASAPKIMTRIVETVIEKDDIMKKAVSSYVDDLFES